MVTTLPNPPATPRALRTPRPGTFPVLVPLNIKFCSSFPKKADPQLQAFIRSGLDVSCQQPGSCPWGPWRTGTGPGWPVPAQERVEGEQEAVLLEICTPTLSAKAGRRAGPRSLPQSWKRAPKTLARSQRACLPWGVPPPWLTWVRPLRKPWARGTHGRTSECVPAATAHLLPTCPSPWVLRGSRGINS